MKIILLVIVLQLTIAEKTCSISVYVNEKGECEKCPSGYYCPDGVNKFICPDGTFTNEWEKECHQCGCDGCIKADIKNETTGKIVKYGGSCTKDGSCYPGYGYDEDTKSCKLCKSGYFSIGGWMSCISCDFNTISTQLGQTKCEECPLHHGTTDKHTKCVKCHPGKFYRIDLGSCVSCRGNTISEKEGQTECIQCPEDMHANEDHTKCLPGSPEVYTGPQDFVMPTNRYKKPKTNPWIQQEKF